jgi:hypothetical protein
VQDLTILITSAGSLLGVIGGLFWPARQSFVERRNSKADKVRADLRSALDDLMEATRGLEREFSQHIGEGERGGSSGLFLDDFQFYRLKLRALSSMYSLDSDRLCEKLSDAAHSFVPFHSRKIGGEKIFSRDQMDYFNCLRESEKAYNEAASMISDFWAQVDKKYPLR